MNRKQDILELENIIMDEEFNIAMKKKNNLEGLILESFGDLKLNLILQINLEYYVVTHFSKKKFSYKKLKKEPVILSINHNIQVHKKNSYLFSYNIYN